MKNYFLFILLAALIFLPSPARSDADFCDFGQWYGAIGDIIQKDENVHLSVAIKFKSNEGWACGPMGFEKFRLWRINEFENKELFSDRDYRAMMDFRAYGPCQELSDSDFDCTNDPTGCEDCDGDGLKDCPKGFCTGYSFQWVDHCVPPGKTEYHLASLGGHFCYADPNFTAHDYYCVARREYETIDSGFDCGPWQNADPSSSDPCLYQHGYFPDICDQGSQGDDVQDNDGDDDDSGCGGCGIAAANPSLPLFTGMMIVGLFMLLLARKRKK